MSQEARSHPPLLPIHAVPSEGLSFSSRTMQEWDTLNSKSTFQLGILAPTSSPHSGSGSPIMILPRIQTWPYLMKRVHRRKMMRPTMLGASHHWVS